MVACREGHDSASDDFCDVCGTRIGGSPAGTGRGTGEHDGLGPRAANGSEPCPACGASVSGPFCHVCGFGLRARRPFAPLVRPAEPISTGFAGPQSPSRQPVLPPEAFPPVSSSSGPPESLFPPLSRPQPQSPPGGPMEPPPSSWSPPERLSHPSWSHPEPPAASSDRTAPPPSPPEEAGSPEDSAVTDLLASLFSPASPTRPEPSSFPAPVQPPPAVLFESAPAATAPPEPPPAPVRSEPPELTFSSALSVPPTTPTPSFTPVTWTVLVSSDRGYYDRMRVALSRSGLEVAFPAHVSERRILLIGKQMRIGRRSAARELEPEIDLAEPPVDPGISRLHAILIAAPDGTWSVLDPGSVNGTQLNGRMIATGDLVALRDGDRINLGAWTVISVYRG
jgi:FHA domain